MHRPLLSLTVSIMLLSLCLTGFSPTSAAQSDLHLIFAMQSDCGGSPCLYVKLAPGDPWSVLGGSIANLSPDPGFEYQLLVRDTGPEQYQLVRILSKTRADAQASSLNEDAYTETGEFLVLDVYPEWVECMSFMLTPMTCMQTRLAPDGNWENSFGGIGDFGFEPGYDYQIIVRKAILTADNLADVSSTIYKLDHILSKTPAG